MLEWEARKTKLEWTEMRQGLLLLVSNESFSKAYHGIFNKTDVLIESNGIQVV
jgi:hypothetical protein